MEWICQWCGEQFEGEDKGLGMRVTCPNCGRNTTFVTSPSNNPPTVSGSVANAVHPSEEQSDRITSLIAEIDALNHKITALKKDLASTENDLTSVRKRVATTTNRIILVVMAYLLVEKIYLWFTGQPLSWQVILVSLILSIAVLTLFILWGKNILESTTEKILNFQFDVLSEITDLEEERHKVEKALKGVVRG